MNYRTTKNPDGSLIIHDVEIFAECVHTVGGEFDSGWVERAFANLQSKAAEKYYPPLHVLHHEAVHEYNDAIVSGGHFEATAIREVMLDGRPVKAIIADLHVTNPEVAARIVAKQLPYRSVEIMDPEREFLDSLALLDHEAPFLKFPMLHTDRSHFRDDLTLSRYRVAAEQVEPLAVLASQSVGTASRVLFRAANMTTKTTPAAKPAPKTETAPKSAPVQLADKDEPEETDMADGEGGGLSVDAIVSAIESGEISVKDFAAIQAAMGAVAQPAEEEEAVEPPPDVDMAGLGFRDLPSSMRKQFSAMAAKLEALQVRDRERQAADKRREDVANALVRLDGRALGSDAEARFSDYHKKNGPEAFADFVAELAQTVGYDFDDGDMTAASRMSHFRDGQASEAVLAFEDPDQREKAASFSAQWRELHDAGRTTLSEKRYVELNMRQRRG